MSEPNKPNLLKFLLDCLDGQEFSKDLICWHDRQNGTFDIYYQHGNSINVKRTQKEAASVWLAWDALNGRTPQTLTESRHRFKQALQSRVNKVLLKMDSGDPHVARFRFATEKEKGTAAKQRWLQKENTMILARKQKLNLVKYNDPIEILHPSSSPSQQNLQNPNRSCSLDSTFVSYPFKLSFTKVIHVLVPVTNYETVPTKASFKAQVELAPAHRSDDSPEPVMHEEQMVPVLSISNDPWITSDTYNTSMEDIIWSDVNVDAQREEFKTIEMLSEDDGKDNTVSQFCDEIIDFPELLEGGRVSATKSDISIHGPGTGSQTTPAAHGSGMGSQKTDSP